MSHLDNSFFDDVISENVEIIDGLSTGTEVREYTNNSWSGPTDYLFSNRGFSNTGSYHKLI